MCLYVCVCVCSALLNEFSAGVLCACVCVWSSVGG